MWQTKSLDTFPVSQILLPILVDSSLRPAMHLV